ncbi:MAG: 23S rRNA (pseudouridine(1915)-N(3))-methyltransferase RlmH [Bdellovibrionota bacterium]
MKVIFLYIESQKEDWALEAQSLYTEKIKRFSEFEIIKIKSPSIARDNKAHKIEEESKMILGKLKSDDYFILFDEEGKIFDSIAFAQNFKKIQESNPKRIVFLIGGAFGVSTEVKARANQKLSLSKMVMNHHVALTMALEQIYRTFTILKGIPYHNS